MDREQIVSQAATVAAHRPWLAQYGDMAPELPPLKHQSLAALLSHSAARFAELKAFTTCMPNGMNGSMTYAEVDAAADAFAVYLREGLGLAAGSRVAVQLPNCLSYPVAAFGIFKAGCVLVNVNPLYTAREMALQLSDSGAEALVIIDLFVDKLAEILPQTAIRHVVVTSVAQFFPALVGAVVRAVQKYWNRDIPPCTIAVTDLDQALAEGRRLKKDRQRVVEGYWRSLCPDSLAALQYTGGTTGQAKGEVQQQMLLIPMLYSLFIIITSTFVTLYYRRGSRLEALARDQAKIEPVAAAKA